MKERPIIFNGDMVRAILHGSKTQTRRVIKLSYERGMVNPVIRGRNGEISSISCRLAPTLCPFGQVGDRLWVRETFATLGNEDGCAIDWNENLVKGGGQEAARIYRASCEQKAGNYGLWSIPDIADWKPHTWNVQYEGAWVPSIHMPRDASRILLEITAVRVERLNDINEEDAHAEGATPSQHIITPPEALYRVGFSKLWRSIYGEESWGSNPWVWVIKFKHVEVRDVS